MKNIAAVFAAYNRELKRANALDFDDIIGITVKILEENPQTRNYWMHRFSHIFVDEYQDTNTLQYKLVSLLREKAGNLCVVGDDDQSIYRFRGATIENILRFEEQYPGATVVKLECNYPVDADDSGAAQSGHPEQYRPQGKDSVDGKRQRRADSAFSRLRRKS